MQYSRATTLVAYKHTDRALSASKVKNMFSSHVEIHPDKHFKVEIDTSGDVFLDYGFGQGGRVEVARILRKIADRVEEGGTSGSVNDSNGNACAVYGHRGSLK